MRAIRRARRLSRRSVLLLGVICALLPLIVAAQASADHVTLQDPPTFSYVDDEACSKPDTNLECPDDQPGQKDLSSHAVATPAPGDLWVSWKWDVTGLSGGNTGDACALFDTDTDGRVNAALCLTISSSPAAESNTRVYTCGDAKVDRCTSQVAQVSTIHSICDATQPPNSDPFHAGQADTVAVCHVHLPDVGGVGTASLVNTCSYPSEQPNSDPSDCVLIPRDAFIRITKAIDVSAAVSFGFNINPLPGSIAANPAVTHAFTSGGATTLTSVYLPIQSGVNHSVQEIMASGWEIDTSTGNAPSCSGSTVSGGNGSFSGTTISSIKAAEDNQITCTFKNKQQKGSAAIAKVDDAGAAVSGAVFTVYTPAGISGGAPTGTAAGTCTTSSAGTCTIANLAPGGYTIDETPPTGYAKDPTFPKAVTITAGGTTNVSATDPRLFKVIVLVCKKSDNTLYSSKVAFDGASLPATANSLATPPSGLTNAQLCGLGGAVHDNVQKAHAGGGDHTATVNIP